MEADLNPILLCPAILTAFHGDIPMKMPPAGYDSGLCHYDGTTARGYTLATDGDARSMIVAKYGEATDVSTGDETIITWSDLDAPRNLSRDGIRIIVLIRHGTSTRVHVSALRSPAADTPPMSPPETTPK